MRIDSTFAAEVKWCSENGLPHSTLLTWEPDDRSKLLAHLIETAKQCQSCGTAEWEWEEDKYAYEAAAYTCHGCQILEAAREDQTPGAGTRMILIPKEKAQRLRGM